MEDRFFHAKEKSLLEARRKLEHLKETKENLAKVSGIKNDAVLAKLVELNIRPEILATLFAIPLIEVAWADGEMHEKEREKLFQYAEKAGMKNRNVDLKVISAWLNERPDPGLMEAWTHYIQSLCSQLTEAERLTLKEEVMTDARDIAHAAGGFLGFGKLSQEEQAVLSKLEAAFG